MANDWQHVQGKVISSCVVAVVMSGVFGRHDTSHSPFHPVSHPPESDIDSPPLVTWSRTVSVCFLTRSVMKGTPDCSENKATRGQGAENRRIGDKTWSVP